MSEKNLKSTLQLPKKVELRKTIKDIKTTEKAVQSIHRKQSGVKRITIDVPGDLYTEMKIKTFKKGTTLKEYVLGLIASDLALAR